MDLFKVVKSKNTIFVAPIVIHMEDYLFHSLNGLMPSDLPNEITFSKQ